MTTSASPEEISPIRQTKIIATLGPAVASGEAISALVGAGMNVARLNFSHGNHENHRRFVEWVRAAAAEHSRPVAILQDIQGPKLRVGSFPGGSCDLPTGSEVVLVSADKEATPGLSRSTTRTCSTTWRSVNRCCWPTD